MSSKRDKPTWMRTLRFRLMAWNAFVVVVTACVTLVALREGVRRALIHELDQVLREDIREIEIALNSHEDKQTLHEQLDRKDIGHAQHEWFAELIRVDGTTEYETLHAPPGNVWDNAEEDVPLTSGEWRLLVRQVPAANVAIRVGASLSLIQADIARLDGFVILCAGGVLLIAPVCGYLLASRATKPLADIISTTARLRPTYLDERLVIRGTGDELDRLSQTLNHLLDRIGKYLQEHRDFLANSAHELRTPLAAIRSSIEVALAGGRTREEYEELLADIIEESASLELLVNQLLLLAETEAERLKTSKLEVRFDELVAKAIEMFSGVAEFRDIQLRCSTLPEVVLPGNRQHLRQVIHNLLDNALKFTESGGQVHVELTVAEEGRVLVFSVKDSGAGISPDDLPQVFDRFFQGQRGRSGPLEKRGTGLGLSICQAIVQAHDGTIEVTSKIGVGTEFILRLPMMEKFRPQGLSHWNDAPHSIQ